MRGGREFMLPAFFDSGGSNCGRRGGTRRLSVEVWMCGGISPYFHTSTLPYFHTCRSPRFSAPSAVKFCSTILRERKRPERVEIASVRRVTGMSEQITRRKLVGLGG